MYIKYKSTPHLPWSENYKPTTDNVLKSAEHFIGKQVVVTEKMDGENCTIYDDGKCHARSLDSGYHPSRTAVRKIAGDIAHLIPKGWRICGENMFAKHSIFYDNLEDYFLVFSIWNEKNVCLSWRDTMEFCKKLNLSTVPVLGFGPWDDFFRKNIEWGLDKESQEGYVVRFYDAFAFEDFDKSIAKFVRKNHVQTDEHWLRQPLVRNLLKND